MSQTELSRLVEGGPDSYFEVLQQGTTDACLLTAAGGRTVTVNFEEILRSTDVLLVLA